LISVGVLVPLDILAAIDDQMGKTPRLMQVAFKREVSRLRTQILVELAVEPGPPKYPLRWKSNRQRRAVMAKLRSEGNLPYQRTHRLVRGWRADYLDTSDGGLMRVYNEAPYAEFVQGDNAQPFHLDSGWVQAAPVLTKWEDRASDRLIEIWFTVSDPFAGVPQT